MKTSNFFSKVLIIPAVATAVFCSSPYAWAVNNTWDGGGANGNWDNIVNWQAETTIPLVGQSATFTNAINTTISLNGADRAVLSLLFNAAGTGSYAFNATGAERFLISSTVQIAAAAVLNPVVTFNVPITLAGNVSFNNVNASATAALIFNGNITNSVASTLTLTGNTTSPLNKLSGTMSDGVGAQSLIVSSAGTGGVWELSGPLTFSGTVAKSGNGTLVLSASNSYAGVTTASGGILNIRHSNALGSTAAGTTIATTASLQLQGGISVGAEALTLNTTTTITNALRNISGNNTYGGAILLSNTARINSDLGTLTLNNGITGAFGLFVGGASDTNISGVIGTGAGGLTKDGAGVLVLSGSNTYTGVTSVAGGTLSVDNLTDTTTPNAIGQSSNAAANLVLGNAGIVTALKYTGAGTTTDRLFTFNSTSSVLTIDASGSGAINFTNSGSMAYGANTNTSARNLTLTGSNTGDNTLTTAIADRAGGGATGIIKSGLGTWVLAGSNAYTGLTAINAGTLAIASGDINSSAVSVAVGAQFKYNSGIARTGTMTLNGAGAGVPNRATLSGTGTINVAVNLDNIGDTLSPGNSPGIQTFTPNQTWSAFTYLWETNNFTGTTAGTDFDMITLAGSLNLTGGSGAYLLDVFSLTAGNVAGTAPNFSEVNRSWTILTTGAGITGFNVANWTVATSNFSPAFAGTWSISQPGNDLVLNYTIPEPGTFAMILGGAGVLLGLRRKRRSLRD